MPACMETDSQARKPQKEPGAHWKINPLGTEMGSATSSGRSHSKAPGARVKKGTWGADTDGRNIHAVLHQRWHYFPPSLALHRAGSQTFWILSNKKNQTLTHTHSPPRTREEGGMQLYGVDKRQADKQGRWGVDCGQLTSDLPTAGQGWNSNNKLPPVSGCPLRLGGVHGVVWKRLLSGTLKAPFHRDH